MEVFNDDDCTGKSFTFSARRDRDLFIKDIEDADDDDYDDQGLDEVDTDDLDDFGTNFDRCKNQSKSEFSIYFTEEEIKCVKCTCGGNNKSGLKKGSSGFFGSIKDAAKSTITGAIKGVLGK